MRVIGLRAKDVYVTFEMSLTEVRAFSDALNGIEIKVDEKSALSKAQAASVVEFAKMLNTLIDEYDNGA
jgi:hypothetical protein